MLGMRRTARGERDEIDYLKAQRNEAIHQRDKCRQIMQRLAEADYEQWLGPFQSEIEEALGPNRNPNKSP